MKITQPLIYYDKADECEPNLGVGLGLELYWVSMLKKFTCVVKSLPSSW